MPSWHRDAHLWNHIRTRLVLKRQLLGWSQYVLAARLGTTQGVVSNLENGYTTPRIHTLEVWSTILGMDFIMDIADTEESYEPPIGGQHCDGEHQDGPLVDPDGDRREVLRTVDGRTGPFLRPGSDGAGSLGVPGEDTPGQAQDVA